LSDGLESGMLGWAVTLIFGAWSLHGRDWTGNLHLAFYDGEQGNKAALRTKKKK